MVTTSTNVTLHKYICTSLTDNSLVTNKIHFPIPTYDLLEKFIQLEFVSCMYTFKWRDLTNHWNLHFVFLSIQSNYYYKNCVGQCVYRSVRFGFYKSTTNVRAGQKMNNTKPLADLCHSIFAEALVSILNSIFDGNKISPWEIKCGLI